MCFIYSVARLTSAMLITAKVMPIQFFTESCSLKKTIPNKVEIMTMPTLFIVKIPELSNKSLLSALTKKYIEK